MKEKEKRKEEKKIKEKGEEEEDEEEVEEEEKEEEEEEDLIFTITILFFKKSTGIQEKNKVLIYFYLFILQENKVLSQTYNHTDDNYTNAHSYIQTKKKKKKTKTEKIFGFLQPQCFSLGYD